MEERVRQLLGRVEERVEQRMRDQSLLDPSAIDMDQARDSSLLG
jgi:hypothetical protein